MKKNNLEAKYNVLMKENKMLRSALEGLLFGEDGAVLRLGSKSPKVRAAQKALSLGVIIADYQSKGSE